MVRNVEAIYENGVLRPLTPLRGLAEHTRLHLSITESAGPHPLEGSIGVISDEDAAQMKKAIEEAFEKVEPDEWR